MSITLQPDLERRLRQLVESGRYESESAVIAEALQLLEEQELSDNEKERKLQRNMRLALDQLDAGDAVDGEEFLRTFIAKKRVERGR